MIVPTNFKDAQRSSGFCHLAVLVQDEVCYGMAIVGSEDLAGGEP